MEVRHIPPRKARMNQSTCLGWCFLASLVIIAILAVVSLAWGQDHPFPFKTWEELVKGTPAWALAGEVESRYCPGVDVLIAKANYISGAGSNWRVFTDGKTIAAAYYPPGVPDGSRPISIVTARIENGQVIVERNEPYDPDKHTPCGPFQQKSARGGSDGC